jgi:hypothetical protein
MYQWVLAQATGHMESLIYLGELENMNVRRITENNTSVKYVYSKLMYKFPFLYVIFYNVYMYL